MFADLFVGGDLAVWPLSERVLRRRLNEKTDDVPSDVSIIPRENRDPGDSLRHFRGSGFALGT